MLPPCVTDRVRWPPSTVDPLTSGVWVLARSFTPMFAVFGLQRVNGRRTLRRSVGTFIWVQGGHHGFAGEPRDSQKSWCRCSFRCKDFTVPLLPRIKVYTSFTHGTYTCSTETQTYLKKSNRSRGTPFELLLTATALLKVRNSLSRP